MIVIENARVLRPGVEYVPLLDAVLVDLLLLCDEVSQHGDSAGPDAWRRWYERTRRREHWPHARYLLVIDCGSQIQLAPAKEGEQ